MGPLFSKRQTFETQGCARFGFRDITQENTRVPVEVRGKLPHWLHGTLYAHVGGAFAGPYHESHPLDGLAHVCAWDFTSPDAPLFSNKFVNSDPYQRWKRTKERVWQGTATEVPEINIPREPDAAVRFNLNVSFWRHALGICAASEFPGPVVNVLDDNLDTKGELVLCPEAEKPFSSMGLSFAGAHYWENDDARMAGGDIHVAWYVRMKIRPCGPKCEAGYRIMRINKSLHTAVRNLTHHASTLPKPQSAVTKYRDFPVATFAYSNAANVPLAERISFAHSFALTSKYVIVPVSSKRLRYDKFMRMDFSNGFFGLFIYEPQANLEFHVFDVHTMHHITTCTCSTHGMLFHVIHAMEIDSRTLTIDVSGGNGEPMACMGTPLATEYAIWRFTLRVDTGTATREQLTQQITDFAMCSPVNVASNRGYRFLYGVSDDMVVHGAEEKHRKNAVWKEDVGEARASGATTWQLKDGAALIGSEPQFVPRPGGGEEDDGVVLVPASRPSDETSWLIVLDAQSMEEIARLFCPVTLNAGIHNLFVPDASNDYFLKC